ncbi:GNAT family N-acetyltransferase [Bacillus sp. M6-12]|uniref:GNAT family N-acetyltransferase n=1 Tax=Bacillus sp. M6-12 TaxID=2054166 RepID=UPI000C78EB2F|nr:GNAT family N-acetyltransferase [Bacillus sp. M6-12]PLS15853.1 GNAT family N-acetyltransferase [Bacillus sp. M6-12]
MNVKQDVKVELSLYHSQHKETLNKFYLPEEQKQFTGLPVDILSLAIEDIHRFPLVILADSIPVGFFVLYDGEDIKAYTTKEHAMLLRAFSINHADQGKGYAKKGLLKLTDFVKKNFPQIEEIVLAVNAKNLPAKNLYLRSGFQDSGVLRIGPIGPQHILVLPIR